MTLTEISPVRKKALAYYRTGHVQVIDATSGWDLTPVKVIARVLSSREGGPTYAVDLDDGVWRCSCPWTDPCSHIYAVQHCTTGVPS